MISISGKQSNGVYVLQTNEAVGGKKQTVTAQTRDAALRVAYFWYRLYVYEKLTAWVHQRIYAIEFSHDPTRLAACSKLLEQLENHRQASLDALALMVCRQQEKIEAIAPQAKSKHYKIYQHIVLPIVAFCKSIAEGQVLTISKSEA